MKTTHWLFVFLVFLTPSCDKDASYQGPAPVPSTELTFKISYHIDGKGLIRDSILYFNDAGNNYSVYNVLYYLSKIRITRTDGQVVHLKDIHYVDCFDPETNKFTFKDLPEGTYTDIRFNIGIDSSQNDHTVLPTTIENINMEWPDLMGGGYHFLRLEGYFVESGTNFGYAMHIGTNDCLIPVKLTNTFTVTAGTKTNITLKMNINEWFRNPNNFDFNIDGNYIMGDLPAMMKITKNGRDVFTL